MEHRGIDETDRRVVVPDVTLAQLASGDRMSVQHYRFEPGAVVPEHRHEHEQAGFIHRGTLTFLLENGREVCASAGDGYVVPGEMAHRVENRGDEPAEGVDVFSPPRAAPDWGTE